MHANSSLELPTLGGLEEELRQAIFEGFVEVPMLPEVANRALSLTQDPEASAAQMAELIQGDQSLAGHVMRIANSVAYTPMANLTSLQQAVARLGMNVICEIALAAVIGAKLFNTPGYEDYVEFNWQHALASSLWSKEIARQAGLDQETAFLSGLLHSIGRPAVLQTLLELANQRAMNLTPEEVHRLEQKYSQPVSELVVTRWKMPTAICEAIKPYQSLDKTSASFKIAATVHAAARLASYMLDVGTEEDETTLLELEAFEVLGLNEGKVEQLLALQDSIQLRVEQLAHS
jgi:HD-like signal output (HDOD) protein